MFQMKTTDVAQFKINWNIHYMKTINTNIQTVYVTIAAVTLFAIAGASTAFAATYSYVTVQGNVATVEAVSADAALKSAVNKHPNSGVILGTITANTSVSGNTNMSNGKVVPTTDTKAADLRVQLNALLREHVNLGLLALYNVIDNDDATTASVEALDNNTNELAAVIGSVYGNDAQAAFDKIWTTHIGFFASYATGLRTNDKAMRDEAEANLKGYQSDIANLFKSVLPAIDTSTVIAGAGEHKDLLIEAMNEYHAGNFKATFAAQRKADKQIAGIANLLSGEIVKQNPSLF